MKTILFLLFATALFSQERISFKEYKFTLNHKNAKYGFTSDTSCTIIYTYDSVPSNFNELMYQACDTNSKSEIILNINSNYKFGPRYYFYRKYNGIDNDGSKYASASSHSEFSEFENFYYVIHADEISYNILNTKSNLKKKDIFQDFELIIRIAE